MRNWAHVLALAFAVPGANAQTGSLSDLGTLLSGQKNLTTFYSLIQKYPDILLQLPSTQGVTILAPNNDAFNKIPYTDLNSAFQNNDETVITNVLEYHLLQGSRTASQLVPGTPVFIPTLLTSTAYTNVSGGQRVENVEQAGDVVVLVSGQGSRSTVTQKDLQFTGGYVQVIDSLLVPPKNVTDTLSTFNITSFEGALFATGQMSTFSNTPNVTIFAPSNDGFQALGPAVANMTVEELTTVLDYHLVPQLLYSTDLVNGTRFLTKQGENITVTQDGNNLYINSAQLLNPNLLCANGVIHLIDNVLNPQGPGAQPNPQIPSQAPVFASASEVNYLPFTSAIPCTSSCPIISSQTASGSGSVTGGGATTRATTAAKTSGVSTSSSKAQAAAVASETGFNAAGLMIALGGAVLMI